MKNSRKVKIAVTVDKAGSTMVFLCHGLGGSRSGATATAASRALAAAGISACRLDFTGHGESGGALADITLSRALDDLESVYVDLTPKKFGVLGSSFGGAVALLFASRHPETGGVFLKSPVRDLQAVCRRGLGPEEIHRWQREGRIDFPMESSTVSMPWDFYVDAGRWDVERAAKSVKAPIEIVHGSADDVVPVEESRRLPGTVHVLPDVGHRFSEPGAMDRAAALAADFFRRHLG